MERGVRWSKEQALETFAPGLAVEVPATIWSPESLNASISLKIFATSLLGSSIPMNRGESEEKTSADVVSCGDDRRSDLTINLAVRSPAGCRNADSRSKGSSISLPAFVEDITVFEEGGPLGRLV
jgi:hypothetical protein